MEALLRWRVSSKKAAEWEPEGTIQTELIARWANQGKGRESTTQEIVPLARVSKIWMEALPGGECPA